MAKPAEFHPLTSLLVVMLLLTLTASQLTVVHTQDEKNVLGKQKEAEQVSEKRTKVSFEVHNDTVRTKVEQEDGVEIEMKDKDMDILKEEIENELEKKDIKLLHTSDDTLTISKDSAAAVSKTPLSVDVSTKELLVQTPDGPMTVTVLPDQAIDRVMKTGLITTMDTVRADDAVIQQTGTLSGVMALEYKNGQPVYTIKGSKSHKMLGIIPTSTPLTVFVSSVNGEIVETQQSVLSRIIEFISF